MAREARPTMNEILRAAERQRREMAAHKPAHVTRAEIAQITIDRLQARLDAIATIAEEAARHFDELRAVLVLARGTPARELRAALKRYGRKEK